MKSWKPVTLKASIPCGNMDCGVNELNKILKAAKLKKMMDKSKVPDCRACP